MLSRFCKLVWYTTVPSDTAKHDRDLWIMWCRGDIDFPAQLFSSYCGDIAVLLSHDDFASGKENSYMSD